jgi:pimeloyl-ACP methyl ester carboxylesterase
VPQRVRALVLAPPLPGAGDRVLTPEAQREFWYQAFHQLELAEQLLDGNPDAIRAYVRHAQPGAFIASIGWYRAGSGTVATSLAECTPAPAERITQPTQVLWPEHDPHFPRDWGDRLDAYFSRVTVTAVPDTGHFSPLEAPEAFATAIRETLSGA